MDAVFAAYNNFFNFHGRARRAEYWWFNIFALLVPLIALFFAGIFGLRGSFGTAIAGFLVTFYLLSFIPALSVSVRRLHDIGRSGWWMLLTIVPIAGLLLVVWSVVDSQAGPNEYGPDPKGRPPRGYLYNQALGQPPSPPTNWGPPQQ